MSDTKPIPAVEIALRSDPGRDPDKQVNEDAGTHVETPLGLLAVVCDGMGGHAGGKEAADLAVSTIVECVQNAKTGDAPGATLKAAIEEANRRVFAMPTAEHGLRPGSTVVAVLAHAHGAEIAHVGDSRIYLVHSGAISQVTKDHSMVQELVDRNIIRAEDAATHPDANKILRALGIAADCEVDLKPDPLAYVAGDVFILCSDGLSDLVSASDILAIAGTHPPAQAAGQLVDLANARGGHDNVTALVLRMKTAAHAQAAPTIVKTVPATQALGPAPAAAVPADKPSGPKTVLAGPAPTAEIGAPAAPVPPVAVAIPPNPTSPASLPPGAHSRVPLIVGIGLALVGIAIAAVFIYMSEARPHRVNVPIVPPAQHDAAPPSPAEEDAAAAPPVVTTTTPLLTEPPVCAKARLARAQGRSSASKLEDACRAAGGTVTAPPSSSATPLPTALPTALPTPTPMPTP